LKPVNLARRREKNEGEGEVEKEKEEEEGGRRRKKEGGQQKEAGKITVRQVRQRRPSDSISGDQHEQESGFQDNHYDRKSRPTP